MTGVNLKKISGLPIFLKGNRIFFGASMSVPQTEIKSYRQYKSFFKPPGLDKNKELYYIYRNSRLEKDDSVFRKNGLRYDITVILPGSVGREPVRTIGHAHKLFKGGWPAEIYQVFFGSAVFLFHDIKTDHVYAVRRYQGEKIIIPPQCAHITINASLSKPLLVANIFINTRNYNYDFFKKTHGPSWYPIIRKGNRIHFEKNLYVKRNVAFSWKKVSVLPFGISPKMSLYKEFAFHTNRFSFLSNPKKYSKALSIDSLFK